MKLLFDTLRAISLTLTDSYFVIILIMLTFILYRKNKKTSAMQKLIIGENIDSTFELTISQIVIGIFGGILASIILTHLGVVFSSDSAVDLIFLVSLILMLINPRFICFSYSGSILGIASLILSTIAKVYNKPELDMLKIDIAALMTVIAVLHIVEGILIIIDGKRGSLPVFSGRDDKIIGGFAFQRYWVLPVVLAFIVKDSYLLDGGITLSNVPNWWPIILTSIPFSVIRKAAIVLYPFYGVIGYTSVTFTRDKSSKTFMSGFMTIIYGIVLFALSQLISFNPIFKVIVLIFAPLAHEAMLYIQRYVEMTGEPKYISSENGIMVLDTTPNSPAQIMGIKSGDLITEINNVKVKYETDIIETLKEATNYVWLKIKQADGTLKEVDYNMLSADKKLGVLLVPRSIPKDKSIMKVQAKSFEEILDKLKKNGDNNNDDNND